MNRSPQRSSVAPRSSDPSLRHDARMTSPSSAPTTAGRPWSSTSRAATRPTMPTLHGPWTMLAAVPGDVGDPGSRLGHDRAGQVAAGDIGRLERVGKRPRFGGIVGQQELGRLGAPRPSGRRRSGAGRARTRPSRGQRAMARRVPARAARRRPAEGSAAAVPGPIARSPGSRRRSGRRRPRSRSSPDPPGRAPPAGPPGRSARSSWAILNATPLPASRRSG